MFISWNCGSQKNLNSALNKVNYNHILRKVKLKNQCRMDFHAIRLWFPSTDFLPRPASSYHIRLLATSLRRQGAR